MLLKELGINVVRDLEDLIIEAIYAGNVSPFHNFNRKYILRNKYSKDGQFINDGFIINVDFVCHLIHQLLYIKFY